MLTDSKIRSAKNLEKSYRLTDALGLYLTISTHGAKRWYFRCSAILITRSSRH
ncbi:Arm DNA-binding domain-containing protein [Candidatus Symbiopectobacterium sp. NZEC151]|uniref:Arm DNA-binding domain-containing protein n=1 Tax=Candidatus Symbiopectobacterium sp. NZEC151 TaxID=2820470 RepID=UPI0034DB5120